MRQAAMSEKRGKILRHLESSPGRTQQHSIALHLRGPLDEMMLVNALELLVAGQRTLRLMFRMDAASLIQNAFCEAFEEAPEESLHERSGSGLRLVVQSSIPLPLECRDLGWLNAADMAEEAKSILCHEASAPFQRDGNPMGCPLFRTLLIRFSALQHVLVFTVHPMIASASEVREMLSKLSDLYESLKSDRPAAKVVDLLPTMLQQPAHLLSEIFWRNSPELHALLIERNRTATPYPRDSSIQEVFERQALRTPDAVALVNEEGSLTYAELNEKANQLARFLRRYGIARGERIVLSVERSLGAVVGALAALKAGCAYLPIDTAEPAHHIREIMEHSRPAAVLTQARYAFLFATQDVRIVLLDEDWPAVATEATENIALPIAAEAPACVLYKRDQSGQLRGILLPHRAFVRLVLGSDFMDFGGDEVFLQLARLTDDAWALEVWGPLLNGGQLALLPPGWQEPVQIGSAIEHYGVTALWLNNADLHRIVVGHIEAMAPLRQIVTGTLAPAVLSRLREEYPRLRVISGFGPAENGTFTCLDLPWPNDALSPNSIEARIPRRLLGGPPANTRMYILDRKRELVRLGETGELHIAGDGLAVGYLYAQELTDRKFFLHSFSPLLRERLFRTGRLACYCEDGRIEILGTIDTRVRAAGPEGKSWAGTGVGDGSIPAFGDAGDIEHRESELVSAETGASFIND